MFSRKELAMEKIKIRHDEPKRLSDSELCGVVGGLSASPILVEEDVSSATSVVANMMSPVKKPIAHK